MNKAITDGVLLMPPAFANGLDVWSSGNGTPGSDTYDGAVNAAFVPGDADFGGCLELVKLNSTQKLRYMGETPILPGCYLRVTARVKGVSGNLPSVRIAAWAGDGSDNHVGGLVEVGDTVALGSYGDVVEVSAIIGTGERNGVDMVWGMEPVYGHIGLDLTGAIGGVVRIDDIVVEDITSAFLRTMMDWVDVRDFGAVGDGVTDDAAAFVAANDAASGREVLVSEGTFFLGSDVTFNTPVRFEGVVTMPTNRYLSLTKNFDLPSYIDAFGNEELAFKKAVQSLFNNADHESLDMGGRRITVTEPIDIQAAVSNRTEFAQRRVVRNGQFYATGDTAWDPDVVSSIATYAASDAHKLKNVTNAANIQIGSLVTGNGVGREVYVRSKNNATQEITLSEPLYDAEGTQNFTFTRFKYMLDFSGFDKLTVFEIEGVELVCGAIASGIILAPSGSIFKLRDSAVNRPANRGISSPGTGCQGMLVDRCNFISREGSTPAQDRETIMLNTNANDVKLRNNRATQFRHFAVLGGGNSVVSGNHFFQGDTETDGVRTAGIILAEPHCATSIDGNYIDNCTIEWTNEYDPDPNFVTGYSFSSLSITDNLFLAGNVAPWTGFIVMKPHGSGHFLGGLNVTGNKFRVLKGAIDRIDIVDTSFADLNKAKSKNVEMSGNTFHGVSTPTGNPVQMAFTKSSAASTWVVDTGGRLPFGWQVRKVDSIVMDGKIKTSGNVAEYTVPYTKVEQGANEDQIHLEWAKSVSGSVWITFRMD